ncbi:MAG: hypothetical protein JXA22_01325 [Candidatus Thermoplasmatota archaeon]|nr:hypothetical protein [Candidatus Thermoplasmatota archaeon]
MRWFWVIITIFLFVLSAALIVPVILKGEGSDGFDPYGDDWDDTSEIREALNTGTRTIFSSPLYLPDIDDPGRTMLIITGVSKEYSGPEVDAVIEFVDDGGKLLVACDNDGVNDIADHYGVRYFDHDLLDPSFMDGGKGNISVFGLNASINGRNYSVMLNSPVGLEVDEGDILCQSSTSSCVDLNDNMLRDLDDKGGPIPVIVASVRNPNGGSAVFISASSVVTNQGMEHDENKDLIMGLVSLMFEGDGGPDEVIFDISRRSTEREEGLLATTSYQVRLISSLPIFTISIFIIFAVTSLLWWFGNPRPREYSQKDLLDRIDRKEVGEKEITALARQLLVNRISGSRRLMDQEGKLTSDDMKECVLNWDRQKAMDVLGDEDMAELLLHNELSQDRDTIERIIRWSIDEQ